MKNKFELTNINKARNTLFGIATILVILFHSYYLNFNDIFGNNIFSSILSFIKNIGNFGVDIFLFLSGIGLYFSYSQNSIKNFYFNRVKRVLPILTPVTIIFYLFIKKVSIKTLLCKIFLISFYLNGDRSLWFFSIIFLLYFLYPLFYKIITKYDFLGTISLIFIVLLFNLSINIFFPTFYSNIEIGTTRFYVFIIGIFFGKKIYNKEQLPYKYISLFFICNILLVIIIFKIININNIIRVLRYLYCPLSISFIICFSYLYSRINIKFNILNLIGKYSLVYYILYEKINYLLLKNFKPNNYLLYYFLISLIILLFSISISIIKKQLIIIYRIRNTKENNAIIH